MLVGRSHDCIRVVLRLEEGAKQRLRQVVVHLLLEDGWQRKSRVKEERVRQQVQLHALIVSLLERLAAELEARLLCIGENMLLDLGIPLRHLLLMIFVEAAFEHEAFFFGKMLHQE